jgi:hypothetical protein
MNLLRRTAIGLIAFAVTASGIAVASPAYAVTKPGVVVKVKPKTIWPYSDLHYTKIHWTKLTGAKGYATAVRHVNTCVPSCADANYKNDKVRLKFTRVRTTSTHRSVFTRVRVTVIKTHKVSSHRLPLKGYWE